MRALEGADSIGFLFGQTLRMRTQKGRAPLKLVRLRGGYSRTSCSGWRPLTAIASISILLMDHAQSIEGWGRVVEKCTNNSRHMLCARSDEMNRQRRGLVFSQEAHQSPGGVVIGHLVGQGPTNPASGSQGIQ